MFDQIMDTLPSPKQNTLNFGEVVPSESKLHLYKFKPLEGEKIRVLKLHATQGDNIECSIEQINCSDGGYEALSYVWGSEERPFNTIVRDKYGINQGYIPLTTNLRSALQNLRDAEELKSKVFWIDQICIDQQGIQEKNHQVPLMGQIFKSANRVITYVGCARTARTERIGKRLAKSAIHSFFAQLQVTGGLSNL